MAEYHITKSSCGIVTINYWCSMLVYVCFQKEQRFDSMIWSSLNAFTWYKNFWVMVETSPTLLKPVSSFKKKICVHLGYICKTSCVCLDGDTCWLNSLQKCRGNQISLSLFLFFFLLCMRTILLHQMLLQLPFSELRRL